MRFWASAIRWPAGGILASISRPIFCRLRMSLNIPMSGRPVQNVEPLSHSRVGLDPLVPAVRGLVPATRVDALGGCDFWQLGGVIVVGGYALADRGEQLERNASDRLEVRAGRGGTWLGELTLSGGVLRLRRGLLGCGVLLRLGTHLLRLLLHLLRLLHDAWRGRHHFPRVLHSLHHSHDRLSPVSSSSQCADLLGIPCSTLR